MIWAACANGLHRTGEWLEGLLTHGLRPDWKQREAGWGAQPGLGAHLAVACGRGAVNAGVDRVVSLSNRGSNRTWGRALLLDEEGGRGRGRASVAGDGGSDGLGAGRRKQSSTAGLLDRTQDGSISARPGRKRGAAAPGCCGRGPASGMRSCEEIQRAREFREERQGEETGRKGGNHGRGWLDVLTGELQKGRAWSTSARGDEHQGGRRPRAPGIHELRRFRARSR